MLISRAHSLNGDSRGSQSTTNLLLQTIFVRIAVHHALRLHRRHIDEFENQKFNKLTRFRSFYNLQSTESANKFKFILNEIFVCFFFLCVWRKRLKHKPPTPNFTDFTLIKLDSIHFFCHFILIQLRYVHSNKCVFVYMYVSLVSYGREEKLKFFLF